MSRLPIAKTNCTGGELNPTLHAREDLAIYQNGLKLCENRLPMPEGGTVRRPGTRFVMALPDQTNKGRLLPFKFSRTDARVLILSNGVATIGFAGGGIIQSGGGPYTFALPAAWTVPVLPNIRIFESANLIIGCNGVSQPVTLARVTDTNWQVGLYQTVNGPNLTQNTDQSKTIVASGTTGSVTLTANFAAFQPGHVGSIWRLDEGNLGTIAYWTANENIAVTGATNNPATYRRNSGAVYAAWTPAGSVTLNSGVNAPTQVFADFQSSPGNVIWRFLYQDYGYVKITGFTDDHHVTATVIGIGETAQTVLPDSLTSTPTYRWSEAAWSDIKGWPSLTTYAQQRVGFFVGSNFYLTNTGDDYRFEQTTAPDSAISGTLLSQDGSVLQPQWAYSSGWIVVGCADSEPVIRGPDIFDAITETNVLAVVDKGEGSCWHVPAQVDAGVVNIGVSRKRLHFSKIDRLIDTLNVNEISVYSRHILNGLAAGVAYQHDPHHVIWGYSLNGDLWSATFRPDQQVIGAARHPMPGGMVEDICAIPTADGTGVEVWMIVQRTIGGGPRRFVEVMTQFFDPVNSAVPDATGAWFVDCGLSYAGAPAKTLTAPHLANQLVRVFGDGAWVGDYAADAAGRVFLSRAVSTALMGLPIVARLRTLPLDPARPGSTTRGDMKQATHFAIDLLEAGPKAIANHWSQDEDGAWQSGDGSESLFTTGDAPLAGFPMALFTGRKVAPLSAGHGRRVEIEIVDDHPYPSTILALGPDIDDTEA